MNQPANQTISAEDYHFSSMLYTCETRVLTKEILKKDY